MGVMAGREAAAARDFSVLPITMELMEEKRDIVVTEFLEPAITMEPMAERRDTARKIVLETQLIMELMAGRRGLKARDGFNPCKAAVKGGDQNMVHIRAEP